MSVVESKVVKDLLENGVHFGHQTNKWNPKMKEYVFGEKSGIYIINLKKTEEALAKASEFLRKSAAEGKQILFSGTKKQAKTIIREEAQKCGMFFVDERWLGGCLTNFATIRKSLKRLDQLQAMKSGDIYASLAKKEKANLDREEGKLIKNLGGIRDMQKLPDVLVVVDTEAEAIAVKEARKMKIPVVALIDTNCDPNLVNYPIPGNDDAIRSIKYIVSMLADAVKTGADEYAAGKKSAEIKKVSTEEAEKPVPVMEKDKGVPSEDNTQKAIEEEKEIEEEPSPEEESLDGDIKF